MTSHHHARRDAREGAATICLSVAAVLALVAGSTVLARSTPAAENLKVVVVDGDEAANIVAEKIATAPVVEVRDKDDRRVPNAVVRFVVRSAVRRARRAVFGNGSSEATVTTDAAGRATPGQLTPLDNGRIEIDVEARFRGDVARTTIRQTNYATAQEAARARPPANTGSGTGNTPPPGSGAGGPSAGGAASAGGHAIWLGAAVGAAVAGTAGVLGSRQPSGTTTTNSVTAITGGPATPAATTAVLTASAPATVAAAYVMTPLICGAAIGTPAPRATWNWDVTLTETAGVAVTITQEHFANDAIVRTRNVFIPAGRSFVDRFSPYRLSAPCFNGVWVASPGTVSDVYEGVDANGHAVTATVTVRLAT